MIYDNNMMIAIPKREKCVCGVYRVYVGSVLPLFSKVIFRTICADAYAVAVEVNLLGLEHETRFGPEHDVQSALSFVPCDELNSN